MSKKTEIVQTSGGYDYKALDKDTRRIVQEHTAAIHHRAKRIAQDVWEIGKSLLDVKERLPYGSFGKWLKSEFGWSEDTAGRFMNVAKRFPHFPQNAEFALQAMYLLSEKKAPEEARQEAISRAEQGEKITPELAKELIAFYTKRTNSEPNFPQFAETDEAEVLPESRIDARLKAEIQFYMETFGTTYKNALRAAVERRNENKKKREARKASRPVKKPVPRITPKIKDELAELAEIANLKGEPLETLLSDIIKNYRRKYKNV
jgi:hypothetical protein